MLRTLSRCILFVYSALFIVGIAVAQDFPLLKTFVATDSDRLDVAAINEAAQGLKDQGVEPLVLFVEGKVGQSLDEASRYFDDALESYGLRQSDGSLRKNLLALFVGTTPLPESGNQRPIFVLYEDELFPVLDALAGSKLTGSKDIATFIREDLMVPKLQDSNFTGAFTSVFESVAERLPRTQTSEPVDEPQTVTPPIVVPQETSQPNFLRRFWWLGIPLVALLTFLGLRRPSASGSVTTRLVTEGVADSRSGLESKKQDLSTLLAQLKESLPTNPDSQSEMVLLSSFLQGQHQEELATLHQDYTKATETLRSLLEQVTQGSSPTDSTSEQLAHYDALFQKANEVKAFAQSLNDRWQLLNRELASVPDKLAAMRGSLQQLKAAYKERPDFVTADEVFKPLLEDIAEVESVQQSNRSLEALRKITGVQENITLVHDSITRLMEADQQLDTFEAYLPQFQAQGFKLYKFAEQIPDVRSSMEIALRLIKQGEYKVLDAQVDAVAEQTSDVVDGAKNYTDLHKTNAEKLGDLETLAAEVQQHLDKTAATFAAFHDFAPSSWRDVQGNGTEAQNALNRAQELWEEARDSNHLSGAQEFERAKVALGNASAELTQAETLLVVVDTRLRDLQSAKATAKDQLAQVEKDIAHFETTLRSSALGKNVGGASQVKLGEAKTFVVKAQAELAQTLPDWLVVLKNVQTAHDLADEALGFMRSEQEAGERRRLRVTSEKVEAQSSLQRLLNYAQVHHSEVSQSTVTQIEHLKGQYQQAESKEQTATTLSGDLLAQTLEQTASLYDQVQQQADIVFVQAEQEVADLENLRKKVSERSSALQSRINALSSQLIASGVTPSPLQRQLYTLSQSLPTLTTTDRASLENALNTLQSLEQTMNELANDALREFNAMKIEQDRRDEEQRDNNDTDAYSWGGFGVPSPPRQSSPWWGGSSSNSGSSWSGSSSSSRSSSSSSRSSSRSSSSSSRSSSWGGSGKKSGGGW
jgi:hypothetical protein